MNDPVLPSWLEDGKGLLGDATIPERPRLEFPSAVITSVEPQLPQGGGSVGSGCGNVEGGGNQGQLRYPWIGSIFDPSATSDDDIYWDVVLGDSDLSGASFAPPIVPDSIKCLDIEIADPDDSSASSMSLLVGDDVTDNDGLNFKYGDGDNGNQNMLQLDWTTQAEVDLQDGNGNEIDIFLDCTSDSNGDPNIQMTGVNGQTLNLFIDSDDGPEIVLDDGSGNTITLDMEESAELDIEIDDGSSANLSAGDLELNDADGNSVSILCSDLDGNGPMSIQELDYCDESGTPMKIMVLATAPYSA